MQGCTILFTCYESERSNIVAFLDTCRKKLYEKKILARIMLDHKDIDSANISTSVTDHWRRSHTNLKRLNVSNLNFIPLRT